MSSFYVWIDSPSGQIETSQEFNTETQRIRGFVRGETISSKVMNTALRQSTLITVALMEALGVSDTFNVYSSVQSLKNEIMSKMSFTLDTSLSLTSTKAVQNKVITAALDNKLDKFTGSNYVYATGTGGVFAPIKLSSSATSGSMMYRDGYGRSKVADPTGGTEIANYQWVMARLLTKYDKINKITFQERTDSEQTTIIMNGRVRSYSASSAVDSYWAGIEPTGLTIDYTKSAEQIDDPNANYHWHLEYPPEQDWMRDTNIVNYPPKVSGYLATLTDVTNSISALKDEVPAAGNTLNKLYNLILELRSQIQPLLVRADL